MKGKIRKINELLVNKEISATELLNKYIDYTEKYNPTLNAYINTTYDEAFKYAQKADDIIAKKCRIPLLCGIPMSVKDCISTKDIYTTCGSKMLCNYKSIYDAFVIEKMKDNFAVMLGKTNMDEFAMGSTSETSFFGPTKNPYDIKCVPGGSSGGAAASVGADLAVYALASDTGGSVRQPASFCGCVGLKPTYGSVSRFGLIAHASSFDQIGVISQSVEDASIVFDATNHHDLNDATCSSHIRKTVSDNLNQNVKKMKIGFVSELFEACDENTKDCYKNALKCFETLGIELCEIKLNTLKYALPAYYILACAEAASNLSRYDGVRYGYRTENFENTDEMISKTRSEGFGREVKRRIMLGNCVLSVGYADRYYKKALNMRSMITKEIKNIFKDFDVIIAPTATTTAFELGTFNNPVDMYNTDKCTILANLCGIPAVSVPCGFAKNNMPVGLQIMGDSFCEEKILNMAYAFEDAVSFKKAKPEIGGDCLGI